MEVGVATRGRIHTYHLVNIPYIEILIQRMATSLALLKAATTDFQSLTVTIIPARHFPNLYRF